MKFPYNLSEDRLSLLSKEDRELYEYEHSIFYSHMLREEGVKEYLKALLETLNIYLQDINDDVEFDDMSADEKLDMAKCLSKREALELFQEVSEMFEETAREGELTSDDWQYIRESCLDYITNMDSYNSQNILDEDSMAPGHDMTYWIPDMSGIFSMCGAVLGGLGAVLGGLLVAGKDLIAAKALERYMNRLVELIDNGQNKKKSFFNFLGRRNAGNQSEGCFRTIQESVERTRYTQGMVWAKAAGLISSADDAITNNISNGGYSTAFRENIANKINGLAANK